MRSRHGWGPRSKPSPTRSVVLDTTCRRERSTSPAGPVSDPQRRSCIAAWIRWMIRWRSRGSRSQAIPSRRWLGRWTGRSISSGCGKSDRLCGSPGSSLPIRLERRLIQNTWTIGPMAQAEPTGHDDDDVCQVKEMLDRMNGTRERATDRLRRQIADIAKATGGLIAAGLDAGLGGRASGTFGILYYHRIAYPTPGFPPPSLNVSPERFRLQVEGLLERGFRFLSVGSALDLVESGKAIPRRTAII